MSTIKVLMRWKFIDEELSTGRKSQTVFCENVRNKLEKWMEKNGMPMKKMSKAAFLRTIQMDIVVFKTVFNCQLEYSDRTNHEKYYGYQDGMHRCTLFNRDTKEYYDAVESKLCHLVDAKHASQYTWALTTLRYIDHLSQSVGKNFSVDDYRIAFEDCPNDEDRMKFQRLSECVLLKIPVRIKTRKDEEYVASPYFLQLFMRRWHLYYKERGEDRLRRVRLDDIESMRKAKIKFEEDQSLRMQIRDFMHNAIGVIREGEWDYKPEEILIRVDASEFRYLQTKPLHASQQVVSQDDDTVVISLNMIVNDGLKSMLRSYGSILEVVAPAKLRESMAEDAVRTAKRYSN